MITIYSDVDGCISPILPRPGLEAITGMDNYQQLVVRSCNLSVAPELVEAYNRWAATPYVTMKWATAWEDEAQEFLCPAIGMNGQLWPLIGGETHSWHGEDWWKLKGVREDIAATSPDLAIWLEDDIATEPAAQRWLATQPNVVGISPNTNVGLTKWDLERIDQLILLHA